MKKQYIAPYFTKIQIDTNDIMSLSDLQTTDNDDVDESGNFINRDTFGWKW